MGNDINYRRYVFLFMPDCYQIYGVIYDELMTILSGDAILMMTELSKSSDEIVLVKEDIVFAGCLFLIKSNGTPLMKLPMMLRS